jgi:hypothetical protein
MGIKELWTFSVVAVFLTMGLSGATVIVTVAAVPTTPDGLSVVDSRTEKLPFAGESGVNFNPAPSWSSPWATVMKVGASVKPSFRYRVPPLTLRISKYSIPTLPADGVITRPEVV